MNQMDFQFYGERGIINGMLLDMYQDKEKVQDNLNKFFGAIRLMDGSRPPWQGDIRNCRWMVEPSLAQFGDPDFIARFQSDGTTYAVFFEGKLKDYRRSCLTISKDMTATSYVGQSSKLNVQLALRYRFVQAYMKTRNHRDPFLTIQEDDHQHPDGRKRKLDKPTVLKAVRTFLKGVEKFYFVGLTNDLKPEEPWCIDKVYWPPLQEQEIEKNIHCFGLLTYSDLKENKVVDDQGGLFTDARIMMNMNWPKIDSEEGEDDNLVNREKMTGWSTELKSLAKDFIESDERLKKVFDTEHAGSYSAYVMKRVEMKLMKVPDKAKKLMNIPDKAERLMLGLREPAGISPNHTLGITPVRFTINGVTFYFFAFGRKQKADIITLALLYLDYLMPEQSNVVSDKKIAQD